MEDNVSKKRKRDCGDAGRCSKSRSKKNYAKKRKYYGGKKATNNTSREKNITIENGPQISEATVPTASSSKIINIEVDNTSSLASGSAKNGQNTLPSPSGYRLIDMAILAKVFRLVSCPECQDTSSLHLNDIIDKKKGLARLLQLQCISCLYTKTFFTSKELCSTKKGGRKSFDVNIRTVYACRQIGAGYGQLKKMCTYLNMPSPMLSKNFVKITNKLRISAKEVAERSMEAVATKLRGKASTADVGVSVDGTWQRKGYASMNGIITAISIESGKVLDTAILSKNCKGCTRMEPVRSSEPQSYEIWYAKHKPVCGLNHKGSSPAMETAGAEKIFSRSVTKHKLYYTSFYGDGDSKAYPAVQDIYGPAKPVSKYECIGHYQKRVGTRLRRKKKVTKGLGGRGRLTDVVIDKLQNYFGIALRQNGGNLEKMIIACKASMYHVAGYHDNCQKNSDSWCQFQLDKLNGTSLHNEKYCLPLDVRQAILPIYIDLCKRENLAKCLHGRTQNANESFNGMIWNRIPKANHVGINTLSLGVYDAIAHFNDGAIAAYKILKSVGIKPGKHMVSGLQLQNTVRKRLSAFRMSQNQLKRRKIIRSTRKKKSDKNIEQEGTTYEAGGF